MDGLTPGRTVHYVAFGTPKGEHPALVHRAAIITAVVDAAAGTVSLAVLNPTGLFFNLHNDFDPTASRGATWHWPEHA